MNFRQNTNRFPRWAAWMITAVSVLAGTILLLGLVWGVRAGQVQVELRRQQQLGIALQQAIEYQAVGDYNSALEQYTIALSYDPDNPMASEGVARMLSAAQQPNGVAVAPVAAIVNDVNTTNTPAPAQITDSNPSAGATTVSAAGNVVTATRNADSAILWTEAQSALDAGRPQTTITKVLQIQQLDPTFKAQEAQTILFDAYVQLSAQQDSEDKLEEALNSLDRALSIREASDIRNERTLLANYIDMLSYFGADWDEVIKLLQSIRTRDPNYRDVDEKLLEARMSLGEELLDAQPCDALNQFVAAIELVGITPTLTNKRSEAQLACTTFETSVALSGTVTATVPALSVPNLTTPQSDNAAGPGPSGLSGRLLYSTRDSNDGRFRIYAQSAANGVTAPSIVVEDATQPAMRSDGQRLAFHNLRGDMGGVSGFDPASSLLTRFTSFPEDVQPSWNAAGNRIAFASTRESDRAARLYMVWAQQDGETTLMGFGEAPAWHPSFDLLAFNGCDQTGNNCGLWQMDGNGANRAPLTTIQRDTRPTWSPDGRLLVFTSDGRSGNFDIYRIDATTRQVLALSDSPAFDVLPTVSPDGQWVAFFSNREGAWKLYIVSINGGAARLLAPIRGDLGDWANHKLQWVN